MRLSFALEAAFDFIVALLFIFPDLLKRIVLWIRHCNPDSQIVLIG